MLNFIKEKLSNLYTHFTSSFTSIFTKKNIDTHTLDELERILITSDTGMPTTKLLISQLKDAYTKGELVDGTAVRHYLEKQLIALLEKPAGQISNVILLMGVNGSGKTTCAAKLAHQYKQHNKKVLLVAADTFRAAASEQLQQWADTLEIAMHKGTSGQDPASVVFQGCQKYIQEGYDTLIIDTAGRLQTKQNLMRELSKIKQVITKQLHNEPITTLLTVDAVLGQNSLQQAQLFHEATELTGTILTKMDGTSKGGTIFAIAHQLQLPVLFITCGEDIKDIAPFKGQEFVKELLY